jgi:hypothetical protein
MMFEAVQRSIVSFGPPIVECAYWEVLEHPFSFALNITAQDSSATVDIHDIIAMKHL